MQQHDILTIQKADHPNLSHHQRKARSGEELLKPVKKNQPVARVPQKINAHQKNSCIQTSMMPECTDDYQDCE